MDQALDRFMGDAQAVIARHEDAADRVTAIAPLMQRLLDSDGSLRVRRVISAVPAPEFAGRISFAAPAILTATLHPALERQPGV
jgi:hypothetical protein